MGSWRSLDHFAETVIPLTDHPATNVAFCFYPVVVFLAIGWQENHAWYVERQISHRNHSVLLTTWALLTCVIHKIRTQKNLAVDFHPVSACSYRSQREKCSGNSHKITCFCVVCRWIRSGSRKCWEPMCWFSRCPNLFDFFHVSIRDGLFFPHEGPLSEYSWLWWSYILVLILQTLFCVQYVMLQWGWIRPGALD